MYKYVGVADDEKRWERDHEQHSRGCVPPVVPRERGVVSRCRERAKAVSQAVQLRAAQKGGARQCMFSWKPSQNGSEQGMLPLLFISGVFFSVCVSKE